MLDEVQDEPFDVRPVVVLVCHDLTSSRTYDNIR